MSKPLILHEDPCSGNCHKIKLTAALLGVPLEIRQYDIMQGETRTPEFLKTVNSAGKIPVLQIGGDFLPESNAACWFLAEGSALIPAQQFARADMLRWMFFEQSSHEPNIATLRFWSKFVGEQNLSDAQRSLIPSKRAAGGKALTLLDAHLSATNWLVGDGVTLADIVLFPYTNAAAEGGFNMEEFPNIAAWIGRVKVLPNFLPMG